ncbi:MAG TPA: ATP-binding protein [Candidatus Sulfotelmatobacter sp.]|nr:ATP-binding protein [Candidatus Sulfotelmatobacter sp.]
MIARNVTETWSSERKLRQSEEKFSKAFRSIPLPVTITTRRDGRYIDANEAFLRMVGRRREEVVGRTSLELGIWDVPQDRQRMMDELDRTGRVVSLETVVVSSTGVRRTIQVSAELMLLEDEPCVLAITNDITESKAMEDQLRQAQKMDAIGRLAGGVAHDFNNMVGVILGYCDMAEKRGDIETLRRDIGQIRKAAGRAATLTRQLLTFSRQQMVRPSVINLNSAFEELLQMLSRLIPANIQLRFSSDAALGNIRADAGQLEQIVLNLIVNARDAMTGNGKIIIETKNVELDETYSKSHPGVEPGPYVLLAISDTGHGMDDQTLSRIFEPFFSTKSPGEGTGLGLSMVYGAMLQAGGHVGVYSEIGSGTVFKLYFPRIFEGEGRRPQLNLESKSTGGSETILLVEDEHDFRVITEEMLVDEGYKVIAAANPQMALLRAAEYGDRIHALVTDVVLPGMTGSELARQISQSRPDLKLLYMSGYPGTYMVAQNLLEERVPLLEKPFTRQGLLSQLRAVLTDHGGNSRGTVVSR